MEHVNPNDKMTKNIAKIINDSENLNINQSPHYQSKMKYFIVCGSSISGIGKGATMSSIGILLKACGLRVTCVKIDPYLNIDAGLMSPYEHGEVFVLDDGGEVDLDLGNYEKALKIKLTRSHNITSGKVFNKVINKERKGDYIGRTVQMIPHVTDKIKEMIIEASEIIVEEDGQSADVCLIEVGGTVGDLESSIFFEAIRQFLHELGPTNGCISMISYVPEIGSDKEHKTKPTQFGVRDLKSMGVFPNFIICRSERPLTDDTMHKISLSANLQTKNVITCYNVDAIWDIPVLLAYQNLHLKIMQHLELPWREYKIHKWLRLAEHCRNIGNEKPITIGVCGKYTTNIDAYYSIDKSLQDACFSANRKLCIKWLNTNDFNDNEDDNEKERDIRIEHFYADLKMCDGILVPGGNIFLFYFFRFWIKRCRRDDKSMSICKRKFYTIFWDMFRYANSCN